MSLKGVISDLDGVLVNTVPAHFEAWKRMFGEYGVEFTFEDYEKKVDGIPRKDGARAILTDLGEDELEEAAAKKQGYYIKRIETEGVSVYETSKALIRQLKDNGVKVAVISASKNCALILKKAGYDGLWDAKIDGNDIAKGKPDPDMFLKALKRLGLDKSACIVFEDAVLGVEAAKNAGIFTVGIDRYGDPKRLGKADIIVKDLGEIDYAGLSGLL
ncbi:MAG: hypothetical protein AUJ75_03525 [Candidatus Omnitrophica bacterium CG1_02_49_10]|nr:MAG: hypothetical protein AUJ75_03525 [Candidatus Omnitrophica bacterium CG1_02_49_10]